MTPGKLALLCAALLCALAPVWSAAKAAALVYPPHPSLKAVPTPGFGVEPSTAPPQAAVAPSSAAQKLYSSAKNDILQVRTLLRGGRTQSSVGSGFLIGSSDLVVTNYHVVSDFALNPDTYVGEWVDTGGHRGDLELLAIDVLHDLAVVRVNRKGTGFFRMPEKLATLSQGQYLYSLGNPLDLGFAISEGAYNGVVTRSFYDQLMFTGPINAGMSGGPSVTVDGEIAGINVSKRLDGELVSFLVPARYAQALLKKVAAQDKPPKDFTVVVTDQLLQHQTMMVDRLLASPLTLKSMGPYKVPVRDSDQMRCWGSSSDKGDAQFSVDSASCAMESAVFISETLQTGQIAIEHEYLRSNRLNAARFAELASATFKNNRVGGSRDSRLTAPACTEQFVKNGTLPMRAVLCVRAYRKFAGLYNFVMLTASTDDSMMSLQSRLDARGVSYENGMRLSHTFLDGLSRGGKR